MDCPYCKASHTLQRPSYIFGGAWHCGRCATVYCGEPDEFDEPEHIEHKLNAIETDDAQHLGGA